MVFRRHCTSEIDRPATNMSVWINAARKYDHPGGVDRSTSVKGLDKLAIVIDTEIADLSIDVIRGVEYLTPFDLEHNYSCVIPRKGSRNKKPNGPKFDFCTFSRSQTFATRTK
jgi:hypothetical protein